MRTRASIVAVVLALVVGLPTLASGQCPDGSPPPCGRRVALDTARYAILPFAHREGGQQSTLDGADCAELLTEGFARWIEVRLADKTRVYDALARHGARAPFRIPFDTAVAIARRLGAGKLVMGQLWSFGDTLRLTAGLYDVARGGTPVREITTRVAASGAIGAAFNALADSLLGAEPGAARGAGAEQTHSLRALRAHAAGERAIREWDLGRAAREFRAAIAADPVFARAYLELGQALLWAADSTPDATRDRTVIARRTAELLGRLGTADGALLLAQQAMFERRWPDACRQYREIVELDSTSFAGWYGLAECNASDPLVVADPQDTSRFAFRGSWHTAVVAYRRALLLAPSFNFIFGRRAAERLTRILQAEIYWWRAGRSDGESFYAFPALEGDTLAFHPVPAAQAETLSAGTPPHLAAVGRNRAILIEVTAAWVGAFPRDARAHRALAYALEVNGNITPAVEATRSALTEIRTAQQLEHRPEDRVGDVVTAIRLLVKGGEFEGARRLGDSLLRTAPREVAGPAGVAVLLGRPALAARLVAPEDPETEYPSSADNQSVTIPMAALRVGLELLAYASVGAPAESVAALEQRVERSTASLPAAARLAVRSALLDVPAELVFDAMGPRPAHRATPPGPSWLMAMQWALAHGDTTGPRAAVTAKLEQRGGLLSREDYPPDGAYLDAHLLLAVGDTAAAERTLDAPLNNLAKLHSYLLRYLPLAGGLVRMMALRADLAGTHGDGLTARRWASAVVTLWSGSEPAVQPVVRRMKQIVQMAK